MGKTNTDRSTKPSCIIRVFIFKIVKLLSRVSREIGEGSKDS